MTPGTYKNMAKLKVFYILSMVLLGLLVAFAVFRPLMTSERYSDVRRESLIQQGDGWLLQFDISNYEGKDATYTIDVVVDGQSSTKAVRVKNGESFTYRKEISPDMLTSGEIKLAVYKEGEATPLDEATYHLK